MPGIDIAPTISRWTEIDKRGFVDPATAGAFALSIWSCCELPPSTEGAQFWAVTPHPDRLPALSCCIQLYINLNTGGEHYHAKVVVSSAIGC